MATSTLQKYLREKQPASDLYKTYLDYKNEKILINGYIHWSATGKTGHGSRPKNIRKIIPC